MKGRLASQSRLTTHTEALSFMESKSSHAVVFLPLFAWRPDSWERKRHGGTRWPRETTVFARNGENSRCSTVPEKVSSFVTGRRNKECNSPSRIGNMKSRESPNF